MTKRNDPFSLGFFVLSQIGIRLYRIVTNSWSSTARNDFAQESLSMEEQPNNGTGIDYLPIIEVTNEIYSMTPDVTPLINSTNTTELGNEGGLPHNLLESALDNTVGAFKDLFSLNGYPWPLGDEPYSLRTKVMFWVVGLAVGGFLLNELRRSLANINYNNMTVTVHTDGSAISSCNGKITTLPSPSIIEGDNNDLEAQRAKQSSPLTLGELRSDLVLVDGIKPLPEQSAIIKAMEKALTTLDDEHFTSGGYTPSFYKGINITPKPITDNLELDTIRDPNINLEEKKEAFLKFMDELEPEKRAVFFKEIRYNNKAMALIVPLIKENKELSDALAELLFSTPASRTTSPTNS